MTFSIATEPVPFAVSPNNVWDCRRRDDLRLVWNHRVLKRREYQLSLWRSRSSPKLLVGRTRLSELTVLFGIDRIRQNLAHVALNLRFK